MVPRIFWSGISSRDSRLIDPPDGSDGQWVSREREAITYDPALAATAATNLIVDGGVGLPFV